MPTLFFEDTDPHQKIRFDTFGHSNTMKPVRTKAINDIRFLTPPHADFDARRPAYREDKQYEEHKVDPLRFTDQQKMLLRNATALALKIVDDGYEAMYNYLRFRHDPDNAHVLKFKIRMKMWLGVINYPEPMNMITSAMRRMQDKLQDPETFITFVHMENQRDIQCEQFALLVKKNVKNVTNVTNFTNFKNFIITIPSQTNMARVMGGLDCGAGIRIYITNNLWKHHINECAATLIHELSHKILGTKDCLINGSAIYGAKACKALAAKEINNARTIADNWAMFYMSFGCYPGQEEYHYQAEYEIKAWDKGDNRPLYLKKYNMFTKYQTFEDLEELDAIAALHEPKKVKKLRALNVHISRRVYLELASCGELGHENQGYQARKELSDLKARMEYSESLTNLASKTDEEVNELKKQAQEMAHLEAVDSRDARARRQRIQRLTRKARK